MFNFKSFVASAVRWGNRGSADEGCDFPRRLRAFDCLVIAPYDDKAIIAYLKEKWLEDLTPRQISIYLLLMDWTEEGGPSANWIAEHLEMKSSAVRSCLSVLRRKGYVMHVAPSEEEVGNSKVAWGINPAHACSDPEMLYHEFALLLA